MSTFADYSAAPYEVRMVQGDSLRETFVFRDTDGALIDLTGFTFASQVRETAAGTAVATFTIDSSELADGRVSRSLGTAVTGGLVGRFVHDFEVTEPDGSRRTLLGGGFVGVAEVTRG
jgi:hypothetical protein